MDPKWTQLIESNKTARIETLRAAHLYGLDEKVSDGITVTKNEIISSLHPAQVPRWPSNFAPGIKTKFNDFSEKIFEFTGAS